MSGYKPIRVYMKSGPTKKLVANCINDIAKLSPFDVAMGALRNQQPVEGQTDSGERIGIPYANIESVVEFTRTDAEVTTQDEDDRNAIAQMQEHGDIPFGVKTMGPDKAAAWLAEYAFGAESFIRLKAGEPEYGVIVGFEDDESGHPSKGAFVVDYADERGRSIPDMESVKFGIDDILQVITYDLEDWQRQQRKS